MPGSARCDAQLWLHDRSGLSDRHSWTPRGHCCHHQFESKPQNGLLPTLRPGASAWYIVKPMRRYHYTASGEADKARRNPDEPYSVALERGTLELGFYSPIEIDRQQPHDQDEVYVIVSGRGRFLNGDSITEFGPGDALFVPAGVEHRFLDFSDDTEMWVVFYGPVGGEDV